jgi:hypothetical protein
LGLKKATEISNFRFEISDTEKANANAKANADPSPLKGIRDDSATAAWFGFRFASELRLGESNGQDFQEIVGGWKGASP